MDNPSNPPLNEKNDFRLLLEAGQIINSSLDIEEVLNLVMDKVIELLRAERGFIMLVDEKTGELTLKTRRGMDKKTLDSDDFSGSLSSIKSVAHSGKAIFCPNTHLDPKFSKRASINLHSIRYILCFPMKIKEKIIGVIYADNRIKSGVFEDRHRDLLEVLANQAAIAIENAKLHDKVQKSYLDVIRALANAIEAKNPYTRGHSDRVTLFAVEIIKALMNYTKIDDICLENIKEKLNSDKKFIKLDSIKGDKLILREELAEKLKSWKFTEEEINIVFNNSSLNITTKDLKEIQMAGILHDVGKIGIDESVLNKPGGLTDEEYKKMKEHPVKGCEILEAIELPKSVKDAVLYHQEKYDGTGYPHGIQGESIPLFARIIAVCDAFDAMTSDRVYRKGLGKYHAKEQLIECAGTQFDTNIVEVFLENKIHDIV